MMTGGGMSKAMQDAKQHMAERTSKLCPTEAEMQKRKQVADQQHKAHPKPKGTR